MTDDPFRKHYEDALDRLTDFTKVERAGQLLLRQVFPDLEPIGGGTDFGRDAAVFRIGAEPTRIVAAISLQKTWQAKLREVVDRLVEQEIPVEQLIYVTPRSIARRGEMYKELHARGIELQIYDHEWWVHSLTENSDLARQAAEEYLGITPFRPSLLRTPEEYVSLLRNIPTFVEATFVTRPDVDDALKKALDGHRVVVLHGRPGAGKSRVAVEAARATNGVFVAPSVSASDPHLADELTRSGSPVVIVDDAQHHPPLVTRLLDLLVDPEARRFSLMLVAWTGLHTALVSEAAMRTSVTAVEVGRMSRPQLGELLRAPQIGLHDDRARRLVLEAAEDLPLYAVMGALAVRGGVAPEQVTAQGPLRTWLDGVWMKVPQLDQPLLVYLALRGRLTMQSRGEFTDDAHSASAALGRTPGDLQVSLASLAEMGVISFDGQTFALLPDAASQYAIGRLAYGAVPVVAPGPLIRSLGDRHWDRLCTTLGAVARSLDSDGPLETLLAMLKDSRPDDAQGALTWSTYLKRVAALAPYAPDAALAEARFALEQTFVDEHFPGVPDISFGTSDVRGAILQILNATKYTRFPESVPLLLSIAEAEPWTLERTGSSQAKAPATDELLQLPGVFDLDEPQRPITIGIRGVLFDAIEAWAGSEPGRADRRLLFLTSLLDPGIEGRRPAVDDPRSIQLGAGYLSPQAYAAIAEAVLPAIDAALRSATLMGVLALLWQLEPTVRTGCGYGGPFGASPSDEIVAAAHDVSCRLLALVRARFPANVALQVRCVRDQRELKCTSIARLPHGAGAVELLFFYQHGRHWERREAARQKQIDALAAARARWPNARVVLWLRALTEEAVSVGQNTSDAFGRLVWALAQQEQHADLVGALAADDTLSGWATVAARARHALDPRASLDQLRTWFAGPIATRLRAWQTLAGLGPQDIDEELMALVGEQVADADEDAAGQIEAFVTRVADRPGASSLVVALLHARAPILQGIGLALACTRVERHDHHVPVPTSEQPSLVAALRAVGGLPDPVGHFGLDFGATLQELGERDIDALDAWIQARLAHLATRATPAREPWSREEEFALSALRAQLRDKGYLEAYASVERMGVLDDAYRRLVRIVYAEELPGRIVELVGAQRLATRQLTRVFRLVGQDAAALGDAIGVAAAYTSLADLITATRQATTARTIWAGELSKLAEARQLFYGTLATHTDPTAARVGRAIQAEITAPGREEG